MNINKFNNLTTSQFADCFIGYTNCTCTCICVS